MGHMNVRFYVARAVEGLVGLAAALGLEGAFRPNAEATLLIREQHIRFSREARAGARLHMTAGVIELGQTEARFLQLLVHSQTGEIAASFQSVVAHVTAREGRAFAWSDRTRAAAADLAVSVPQKAAPRGIASGPVNGAASLAEADRMGLIALSTGAFGAQDCDAFGRMRPEMFIGRISDGMPGLAGLLRGEDLTGAPERLAKLGGAVLEYRLIHLAWPRAGDRFDIRSGLVAIDERLQRVVHWMLDPATGRPWGTAEAVAACFDLNTRKLVLMSAAALAAARARITPGLAL
ncbi:MAG: thioesterase family protein [Pseudomonadota bacterium]|nr:thioesterase family protein [Pseudomonadota bacterium]